MRKILIALLSALVLAGLAACSGTATAGSHKNAQQVAEDKVKTRANYVPKNDVEGRNYNARQELADNPATLIWCTAFPTNQNAKPITVPIVGKLTSGNKRPFPTSQVIAYNGSSWHYSYNPELPGPDGMFGSSGEYRYGFRPDGVYVDFYNLETYCTSAPTVYQKQSTTIDLQTSKSDAGVEAALTACRAKNPDPSVPCTEAQNLVASVAGVAGP